ncbi:MAG: hypothetical protein AUK63_526 [bacterium P3]|nr:MAG: hypothetical protein AUK63_526 [bacterium P3]KWW41982.1 MAG: hypothetical protein F083_633 [bacterium F083]
MNTDGISFVHGGHGLHGGDFLLSTEDTDEHGWDFFCPRIIRMGFIIGLWQIPPVLASMDWHILCTFAKLQSTVDCNVVLFIIISSSHG